MVVDPAKLKLGGVWQKGSRRPVKVQETDLIKKVKKSSSTIG